MNKAYKTLKSLPTAARKIHLGSKILKILVFFAGVITFAVLIFLISHILIKGIPNLSPKLFAWRSILRE